MKKVLLTTIPRPLGVENETCTKNIQSELYHAQVTLKQGLFSIRAVCNGWGLDLMAANLQSPTTVLHYPTRRMFVKELKKGYDYVGISFVGCTFPKALELCALVRQESFKTKIILGGYGTVLPECDQYADYVCREEGVNFFKRLLGEAPARSYAIPPLMRTIKVMSVSSELEGIIPIGLGCSRGCDFCCTSHFFDQKYHPLIKTGHEIYNAICALDFRKKSFRNIAFIDEDFLADKKKIMEMAQLNSQEIEKPILFSCSASLQSLAQYSQDELLTMGLSGVWIGIESIKANYPKLRHVNVPEMISDLKSLGINVLISMIIGYDWHDRNCIEQDFQYLVSLKPTLSQIMLYSPCPKTPLYEKLAKDNRLLPIPYKFRDGFHALFKHPYFSPQELEKILEQLQEREYEELGPSLFRILEVQLTGYELLKDSEYPLLNARALEHGRLCLKIYPLLKLGIKHAPSIKVKQFLKGLKEKVEDQLQISSKERLQDYLAPLLYFFTLWRNRINPHQQPRSAVVRYNSGIL